MADNKSNIIVVDDDHDIADLVEIYLTGSGYTVFKAYSAAEGLKIIQTHDIDLAIIDVMMPNMNGIEMCKTIRNRYNFPVIMLSAKSEDVDKIKGLTVGADDYMTKPFNPMELLARIRSQLRRYHELNTSSSESSDTIEVKNMVIDTVKHRIIIDGREVVLTPIEFNILHLLASHPGRVFSTDEIYEYVWNEKIYESNNTVMVHIRRLREKIELNPRQPQIVKTVWGVGYKIDD